MLRRDDKHVRSITQAINDFNSGSVNYCNCFHFGNTWNRHQLHSQNIADSGVLPIGSILLVLVGMKEHIMITDIQVKQLGNHPLML